MNKSDLTKLRGSGVKAAPSSMPDFEVRMLRVLDTKPENRMALAGAADPFASMSCKPDMFKAYCDFQICHSFPQIIGPTGSGAFLGYHPAVLDANHQSLLHQWMNLRHLVKIDNPKQRDRIVGCIIATYFPPTPPTGWEIPATADAAPFITARAVLFKQADGMDTVLGQQQTSRQSWKVSIEVDASLDNIGVYQPSTRNIWSFEEVPDALLNAVSIDPNTGALLIGKVNGEQLAFAYGLQKGQVHFRGVGMTTNPAEKTAKIISINAEGGEQFFRIAAEGAEEELLVGRKCTWASGLYSGTIQEVKKEGKMQHVGCGWAVNCSESDPGVKIYLPRGEVVVLNFSKLKLAA